MDYIKFMFGVFYNVRSKLRKFTMINFKTNEKQNEKLQLGYTITPISITNMPFEMPLQIFRKLNIYKYYSI